MSQHTYLFFCVCVSAANLLNITHSPPKSHSKNQIMFSLLWRHYGRFAAEIAHTHSNAGHPLASVGTRQLQLAGLPALQPPGPLSAPQSNAKPWEPPCWAPSASLQLRVLAVCPCPCACVCVCVRACSVPWGSPQPRSVAGPHRASFASHPTYTSAGNQHRQGPWPRGVAADPKGCAYACSIALSPVGLRLPPEDSIYPCKAAPTAHKTTRPSLGLHLP